MPQTYKFHNNAISLWLVRYNNTVVFSSMELLFKVPVCVYIPYSKHSTSDA